MIFFEKCVFICFINNYLWTMLAQYLVSLARSNQFAKIKEKRCQGCQFSSFSKEKTFQIHLLVESFCIVFQKSILRKCFKLSLILNLFLIFDQISDLCSHKIFLIGKRVYVQHHHIYWIIKKYHKYAWLIIISRKKKFRIDYATIRLLSVKQILRLLILPQYGNQKDCWVGQVSHPIFTSWLYHLDFTSIA